MAGSAPALTDVQEALHAQNDERLLQLKICAQAHIVSNRARAKLDHIPNSELIEALVQSAVLSVTHRQHETLAAQGRLPGQCSSKDLSSAVLALVQQQWHELMLARVHAVQKLLPAVPLVAPARTQQELDSLCIAAGGALEAWQLVGSRASPFNITSTSPAPACINLMYAAEDLLRALTHVVEVPNPADACQPASSMDATSQGSSARASASGQQQQLCPQSEPEQQHAHEPEQQPMACLNLLQTVRAPSRVWLQSFFADLQPDKRQVGLDDVLHPWFREQQVQQAHKAAASCSAAACRAVARTGIPASQRPWVWATALGLHATPTNAESTVATGPVLCSQYPSRGSMNSRKKDTSQQSAGSFDLPIGQRAIGSNNSLIQTAWWQLPTLRDQQMLQVLCEAVQRQGLLADVLTCADAQQAADSAHYFVFEDAMRAVLLAFSRDASIQHQAAVPPSPVLAPEAQQAQIEQMRPYPPSGVLPFQGLAAYLAPLCYMYNSPAAMYPVFRAMYCKYWCRLHSVNIQAVPSAGLPVLCRTFLNLLQEVDPEVYCQLGRLSPSPLELVFPWIVNAFAMHLAPPEVLLLWDRCIGFDSLLPLPVLAVAVMTFRRDLVLAAESSEELVELLQDLGSIRVVPLLQALLFDS